MTDQKSRRWLLYIFDCIALAVGNFGMLGISKFIFNAEVRTDLATIVLFMLCIRLLIVALGDFTGFCDKLWHTVMIVAIEEAAVVIVEYVMVYGLSQRFLIMTAAADLILVMLVHILWRRRQRKAVPADAAGDAVQTDTGGEALEGVLAAEEEAAADEAAAAEDDKDHKVSWLLRGSVLDDADEADEASEASDAADQTEASGSGTALDWLDDDDEDFGSEGSGLFTSEDDDLEEEEKIEDVEAIQQTQEEVPEAVPEQEVNPAQETTPEQETASGPEAAPAIDDSEDEAASEIKNAESEEPASEPTTTEAESETPAAEETAAPETEEVPDEPEQAESEPAAPEAEAASESEDQTAQQEATYRDVEDDLNDFIDVLSAEVSDDAYTEVSARLKASLERLLAFRTDEPFVSTSRELIGQLDGTKSKGDLTTAAIDNVIAVAQQIESIDQVENVIEAPAATAEKPVEAHRVKKTDYNIQDDEILLDSGDSEIIISKEDLEHIRNYMKNHRKSS
jgi:chemotaxis protein histidine kinase CheA